MPPPGESFEDGAKRWFKKAKDFVAPPLPPAGGSTRPQSTNTEAPGGYLDRLGEDPDPWVEIMDIRQEEQSDRLHVGAVSGGNWSMSARRRNLLVLGPPRSDKTSSVVIPSILTAPGPTVVVSTRKDVFRTTALTRSRLGRIYHYGPDGSPTPPGAIELRWSPITASANWESAVEMSLAMTVISDTAAGVTDGNYWRQKASTLLAPLLHAAALGNKDMRWVMRAVRGQDQATLDEAEEILGDALGFDAEAAYNDLHGITTSNDPKHRDSIFSTAATALDVYRFGSAVATTINPNFDAHQFVAGQPEAYNADRWTATSLALFRQGIEPASGAKPLGVYDTIYITCDGGRQEMVAPLVVGLLTEVRKAAYALHEADQDRGHHTRPPVTFILDELYGMAPLKDLPTMLAQCAGNNVYVVGVLHDLGQARDKWSKAGDSFPTVFGTVAAFPRIGDTPTLELLSKLSGETWAEVYSTSVNNNTGRGGSSSGTSETLNFTKIPRLDVGMVHFGNKHSPSQMLVYGLEESFHTEPSYRYIYPTPYYAAPPWPQLLLATMRHFVEVGRTDRRVQLPVPELDLDKSGKYLRNLGGEEMVQQYHSLKTKLAEMAVVADQILADQEATPFLAGYEAAIGPELGSSPVEIGIHIAQRIENDELMRLMKLWGAEVAGQTSSGRSVWSLSESAYTTLVSPKDSPAHLVPEQWNYVVRELGDTPKTVFIVEARARWAVHTAAVLANKLGAAFGCVATWSMNEQPWGPNVVRKYPTGE